MGQADAAKYVGLGAVKSARALGPVEPGPFKLGQIFNSLDDSVFDGGSISHISMNKSPASKSGYDCNGTSVSDLFSVRAVAA
jgi:hypothetical protein